MHNKHGPGINLGFPITIRPRDGTERKPRDGTERKPRDGTILRMGTFVNQPLGLVMGEVCPLEVRSTKLEVRRRNREWKIENRK